jgi:CheY-like chemotaxis protein
MMSGSFYRGADLAGPQQVLPERLVLCVQPNVEHQQFLRRALEGYRLEIAGNAFDALRLSNHAVFDAYIIDYWLPDWAGAALCRDLRKSDPHVPIVFYTAAGSEYAERALRAGAMVYLQVPVDAAALRERLSVLIESADMRDLYARIDEERAIADELQRRAAAAIETAQQASQRAVSAIERTAKLKAAKAFLAAGGTRAGFQRFWPQQFAAARARERLT